MTDESDIIRHRREKLARWRENGRAYDNQFRRDALAQELHARCVDLDKDALADAGIQVAVAGRVMLRRVMGKASFITLKDTSGTIQCYLRTEDVGPEAYEEFDDLWDIGDIVGVRGTMMPSLPRASSCSTKLCGPFRRSTTGSPITRSVIASVIWISS